MKGGVRVVLLSEKTIKIKFCPGLEKICTLHWASNFYVLIIFFCVTRNIAPSVCGTVETHHMCNCL